MTDREEISLKEVLQGKRHNGPNVAMGDIEVSGIVVIKDKDGNIKSELNIISLEANEET